MGERTNEREWERLEKEATCCECNDLFTEPKTLPCLHTFCEKCLENEHIVSDGVCPVPLCRTRLPRDLRAYPTEMFYKCLVDVLRKRKAAASTELDKRCGECVDSPAPAAMWCTTCVNFLCGNCYLSHKNMRRFKLHKTFKISEFASQSPNTVLQWRHAKYCMSCIKHQPEASEWQEIYCQTCHKFICTNCISTDHQQHQYIFGNSDRMNELIDKECDKIKVVDTKLKGLFEHVRAAKEEVEAVDNDMNNEANAEKKIQNAYNKLHENLKVEEANALEGLKVTKDSCHKSLCEQKGQISCLESLLINCDEFVSKVTSKERANQLLTHTNEIQKRVDDLTNQVQQSSLKPVHAVEDLNYYVTSLHNYRLSTLPHLPNCTVKGPPAMSKYGPVCVTIILKDEDGHPVPNQTEHLRAQFKDENIACGIKIEEDVSGSIYVLSYRAKRREMHFLSISWKGQLLDEITVQAKIRNYQTIKKPLQEPITKYGEQNKINSPHLMVLGPNDELIVRDYHVKSLVVFDGDLKFSHMIAVGEPAPTGLAIGKGHLYMSIDHAIKKVQIDGKVKLVYEFGTEGTEDGQFNSPRGLVLDKNGLLYVCDKNNHRIQVLQENRFQFSFGKKGRLPGMFTEPYDLAFNSAEDLLFITDCGNHRIQLFTPNGQFLQRFGNVIEIPGKLRFPTGICYTPDDHVLVCSSNSHCMLIFKDDGTFVSIVDIEGVDGKQAYVDPVGVVMKNDGRIIVAGCKSDKLVVF